MLWRRFGSNAAGQGMPWGILLGIGAASVGIGLVITAAAAMYPALKAARMEPIAAMRVEV
jgi:ABC-type antimicrobial peptide transport system permease subunit